ncbi:hypothetical protein V498_06687 [Pseudogymnoascus sp. VKM F-4517 (FW-2822)]|nr:hypothetical protein V498_06687 [Pseudogymnoascus sp. VKM F-4517 (FW-2822)]
MSNNASGIGMDPKDFAQRGKERAPPHNPYDGMGIPVAAYTVGDIGRHYRNAQRHLLRATAPPAFPTMAEVNMSRDYLTQVCSQPAASQRGDPNFRRWGREGRTFFGERAIGDPGVFVPRAAPPPRATPTPRPSPRSRAPPRPRSPGNPFYSPPPQPERPPPRRRQRHPSDSPPMRAPPRRSNSPARTPPRTRSYGDPPPAPRASASSPPPRATPSGTSSYTRRDRTPPMFTSPNVFPTSDRTGDSSGYTRRERTPPLFGTSSNNPFEVSDDDDDVPPTPSRAPRCGAGAPRPPPPPGGGAGTGPSPPRENRSTGTTRARAAPIANPVLGEEIVVGTWALSAAGAGRSGPNAVIGIFDRRGHLNFRIVARTTSGIPVPAPGGTSVSLHNINLRWPYAGLDVARLRAMIDQHLRLPRDQRP